MSEVTFDMRGLTIELDHEETQGLLKVLTGGAFSGPALTTYFTAVGVVGAAVPFVIGALALHVMWEAAAIKAADGGDGVWLSAPPPVLIGMPGVVIPWRRHPVSQFDGQANDGTMVSTMGDRIDWHIDRGVGEPKDCKFVLANDCASGWAKAYKLYIAQANWWVQAEGHSSAENGGWFNELAQCRLVFHKPQFFGQWGPVGLQIDNLTGVQERDVTTFRWVQD